NFFDLDARFATSQSIDDSYVLSFSARYDQVLTSSGCSALLGVTPSSVVPTKKEPCGASHIETTNCRADAARVDHAPLPVASASERKNATTWMWCSVDFHVIAAPRAVSPPV